MKLEVPLTKIDKCMYYALEHQIEKNKNGSSPKALRNLKKFDDVYAKLNDKEKEVVDAFIDKWDMMA